MKVINIFCPLGIDGVRWQSSKKCLAHFAGTDETLVHNRADTIHAICPSRLRERAAVEHMLLDAVGPADAILWIGHEILMEEHGIGVGKGGVVGIIEWSGPVLVYIEEGVLEIMREIFEAALGTKPVAGGEPVVGIVI